MTGPIGAFDSVVVPVEVSCVEVLAVIQCYVDCECDVTTMLVIAAHLDGCCDCGDELATLRFLKAAVRRCAGAPESRVWP